MNLEDLPDPAMMNSSRHLTVNTPDVRDRDQDLIALGECGTNITDGDIVEIEVVPKL